MQTAEVQPDASQADELLKRARDAALAAEHEADRKVIDAERVKEHSARIQNESEQVKQDA